MSLLRGGIRAMEGLVRSAPMIGMRKCLTRPTFGIYRVPGNILGRGTLPYRSFSQSSLNFNQKKNNDKKDKESDPDMKTFTFTFGANKDGKPGGKNPKGPPPGNDNTNNYYVLYAFLTFAAVAYLLSPGGGPKITWEEFRANYLDKGVVERITLVNKQEAIAFLRGHEGDHNLAVRFTVGSAESFDKKLDKAQDDLGINAVDRIPVSYVEEINLAQVFLSFLPTVLLIYGIYYIGRRGLQGAGGGVFGAGKSKAKKFNLDENVKVKFADVAGVDEAKEEIMEFVKFLKNPKKYERLGARIPRGAILSGPPGTGKTLLAKATAGEAGVPFYTVSGSEFVEMFVGVGASRVRDLFDTARKSAPSIIFIDEIDAIGKARSPGEGGFGGHEERESTLNQLLVEMDGFQTSDHVVVLGGTNIPEVLDKALMRPGRFDRHVSIDKPDVNGRKQIYSVYLQKIKTNLDLVDLSGRLAAMTPGFAGADIANVVNEAALVAARWEAKSVELKHFEYAIERVTAGLEKKSKILTPDDRRTVAYHEAGHAICGWFLEHADPLLKVSIVPRGQGALGYASYLPSDIQLLSTFELADRMVMTLGGRVSEELHFNSVTSGASNDFEKVTQIATAMVTNWGMSPKIGWVNFEENGGGYYTKPFSEKTATTIDEEVRRIVEDAHTKCKALLTEKSEELKLVAEELLAKEVLTRDDMIRLIGKRPFAETNEEFKYLDGQAPFSTA